MDDLAMDELAWLRLQVEWGADEALADQPLDRRSAPAPRPAPATRPAMELSAGATAGHVPSAPPACIGNAVAQAQALAAAASSPEALEAALAGFTGCSLRTTATRLVFRDGAGTTGLVLIADVPGADEDRAGLPFAGSAATLLDSMLASAGLDRATSLCTSLLPWRPPGGRPPTEQEVQTCLPFLHRHLALVQPRYGLLIGGLAARTLLPAVGRRPRAGWQSMAIPGLSDPMPTLALPSLAHIGATPAAKRDAWADLLRLRHAMIS